MILNDDEIFTDRNLDEDDFRFIPRWVWSFAWPAVILIGIAVIEMTSHPMLGTLIICSKLAWGDIATATWVRSQDTIPGRGKSLFWFVLAGATCKVLISSAVLAIGYIALVGIAESIVTPLLAQRGMAMKHVEPGPELMRIITIGLVAFLPVLIAVTAVACFSAKREGIKVWIDDSLDRAYRNQLWPPSCDGLRNKADKTLLIATAALAMATVDGILCACIFLPPPYSFMLAISIGIAVPTLLYLVFQGVVARSPSECWTDPKLQAFGDGNR